MFERTHVGLDVHALTVVACAIDGQTGEIFRGRLTPDHGEILEWIKTLPGPCRVVYEAGPTGFPLARALRAAGIECLVAAPSKLQRPPGDRVKTDRNDALHLARLLKLDQITEVTVPSPSQEAARDLVRAREDIRGDLMRARHRVSKLLLRQGIHYTGGHTWTQEHLAWLYGQRFDSPALQLTYDLALESVTEILDRRSRADAAIRAMAYDSEYTPVVRALECLRGISMLTAFGLAVEIGDWNRFTGRTIGAYLGLVPSENSSGQHRSQGSITKTGNTHARRLLVEAAWHHRRSYTHPSQALRSRWEAATPWERARGKAGNKRLHERWLVYQEHRKRPVIANVAIARELAGWCWSLASEAQRTAQQQIP
ncbi:IS110 family transposase [Paenarthrobacter nitroguajacolicus]|uniref:IS110 family transposase n=1 Tax=Paenarthrobacter nitroguajacolicus TaxID=211146 RepID=UPI00248CB5AB|nr:IS110 family transposase [Paenarthrobacter nitroguajacolicus]MDI2037357.1 IS110 family transposase ISSfr2 [Paenarthrobacter nitroguajacolicus]